MTKKRTESSSKPIKRVLYKFFLEFTPMEECAVIEDAWVNRKIVGSDGLEINPEKLKAQLEKAREYTGALHHALMLYAKWNLGPEWDAETEANVRKYNDHTE